MGVGNAADGTAAIEEAFQVGHAASRGGNRGGIQSAAITVRADFCVPHGDHLGDRHISLSAQVDPADGD